MPEHRDYHLLVVAIHENHQSTVPCPPLGVHLLDRCEEDGHSAPTDVVADHQVGPYEGAADPGHRRAADGQADYYDHGDQGLQRDVEEAELVARRRR